MGKLKSFSLYVVMMVSISIWFVGCASSSFEEAQKLNTVKAYDKFLKEYPKDEDYSWKAKKLREKVFFEDVKDKNTLSGYDSYCKEYPNGEYLKTVIKLRDDKSFKIAKDENTILSYTKYIEEAYSDVHIIGNYIGSARDLKDSLLLEKAKKINTLNSYNDYLNKCHTSFCKKDIIKNLKEPLIFKRSKKIDTLENYDSYLKIYQNGQYVNEVMALREPLFYKKQKSINTIGGYEQYENEYPKGKYLKKVLELKEVLIFEKAKYDNMNSSFDNYLHLYPKGKFVKEAKNLKGELLYSEAKSKNSFELYMQYLKENPKGKYISKVKKMIAEFKFWKKCLANGKYIHYVKKYPKGLFISKAKELILKRKISILKLDTDIEETSYKSPDKKVNSYQLDIDIDTGKDHEVSKGACKVALFGCYSWYPDTHYYYDLYWLKTKYTSNKKFKISSSSCYNSYANLYGIDKDHDAVKRIYVKLCTKQSFETPIKSIMVYSTKQNKSGLYYYSNFDFSKKRNIYNENDKKRARFSFNEIEPFLSTNKQFFLTKKLKLTQINTNKKVTLKSNTIVTAIGYSPEIDKYMVIMPYNNMEKYLISGTNLKNISSAYVKQKYEDAIQSKKIKKLEYVLRYHPEFTKRQEALKVLLKAYDKVATVKIYDKYLMLYKDSVVLAEAKEKRFYANLKVQTAKKLYFIAGKYEREKDFYNAKRVYDFIVEHHEDSKYAEKANDNLLAIVKLEAYKDAKDKAERETRYAIEQAQNEAERRQQKYNKQQKSANKQQCENRKSQCFASCEGLSTKGWFDDKSSCESRCREISCY